jgi:hypothetical protein
MYQIPASVHQHCWQHVEIHIVISGVLYIVFILYVILVVRIRVVSIVLP